MLPGDLVEYRSMLGKVRARVVDTVPDVDRTYYALQITSKNHPQYVYGSEVLVPVDSGLVVFRRASTRRTAKDC